MGGEGGRMTRSQAELVGGGHAKRAEGYSLVYYTYNTHSKSGAQHTELI